MKLKSLVVLLGIILMIWLNMTNVMESFCQAYDKGDSINVEDFLIEERVSMQPKHLYSIKINDKMVWGVPLSEIGTLTKDEWKDIDCLLRLIERVFRDEKAIKAMIKSLSPERFMIKEYQ